MTYEHLDPYAILQILGLHGVTSVTPVRGGGDTAIWRVERAGKVYTLRVFQCGQDDACQHEQAVMQAAKAGGLPVPQVHAAGKWHDYPALLLSWLPGKPVAEDLRAHPWRAWHLGLLFGNMHATIHTLTAPEFLCQPSKNWINWSGLDDRPLQERLHSIEHQTNTLLHLDYHPFNVLINGNKITGVIDWRNACAGDPRADAARTVSMLCIDGIGRPAFLEMIIRRIFEAGWRRGYEHKSEALGDLSLFYAWAGAVMERDLASKRAPEDLKRIHQWTMKWKQRTCIKV